MATSRVCVIDGCDKRVVGRGWCAKHWHRWRTTGDPLKTKSTPRGEAIRYFRETVLPYDGDDCLIWPYKKGWGGYGMVSIDRKLHFVCRLICEAKDGPPPSPKHEVAHGCGKGHTGCCTPNHLRWATPAENAADRLIHGTDGRGEKNGFARLTEDDIRKIRDLRGKLSQRKIAAMFGVSQCHVWRVHHALAWSHLSGDEADVSPESKRYAPSRERCEPLPSVEGN